MRFGPVAAFYNPMQIRTGNLEKDKIQDCYDIMMRYQGNRISNGERFQNALERD